MLRLDTRTGAVSICAKKETGWACNAVPDERQALENEIARLQGENGALKKDMLARGLPLPGGSQVRRRRNGSASSISKCRCRAMPKSIAR